MKDIRHELSHCTLGIHCYFVLFFGVIVFLPGNDPGKSKTSEWPVLVETEHSHEIHTLKGILEEGDVSVIVEDESPEVGGIPTTLTRNRLRVQPGQEEKATQLIQNSDINTNEFQIEDIEA